MQHGASLLCSLLAATRQFSVVIGQKIRLSGSYNGNEMRSAICLDKQTSIEWLYCLFPILYLGSQSPLNLDNSLLIWGKLAHPRVRNIKYVALCDLAWLYNLYFVICKFQFNFLNTGHMRSANDIFFYFYTLIGPNCSFHNLYVKVLFRS